MADATADDQSWLGKLIAFFKDRDLEGRDISRIEENRRLDDSYWNIGTMWMAANMVAPSLTLGGLGQTLFGLGFVDAVLVIFFFNMLAVLTVCYFSIFGAAFGLRQMVLSRFWFGWWGGKGIAVLNVLSCLGWSIVNVIVGAQLLYVVGHKMPGYAGILVLAITTLVFTLFGYHVIHVYEKWSWIAPLIVFVTVLVTLAISNDFVNVPMGRGWAELGGVLSFGSTVFGFGTGYTSVAADYTVYQPHTRPRWQIFLVTWLGILPTLLFTEILGAALVTTTYPDGENNPYKKGYDEAKTGGLVAALLFPQVGTWGKICVVLLALSIIATNCPNIYSVSLSVMVIGEWANRIPRFVWTLIATAVYTGIAIPPYFFFEDFLRNFMAVIGYWLAIYEGIALTEHFVFRRNLAGYVLGNYDKRDQLHVGVAAIVAFLCGVAGVVVGMGQTWWVGPVARHAGVPPWGGDVGFELAFAFASVSYAGFRWLELPVQTQQREEIELALRR